MRNHQSSFELWVWAWRETWSHIRTRKHVLEEGGLMITTFIAASVIAMVLGKNWTALLWGLLAGLIGLFVYVLGVFIYYRTIAARRIREEEECFSAQEVLEYALEHSGLKDRHKIETALREAALRKKITVQVQRSTDSIWTDVSPDEFRTRAIDLVRDCVYEFGDPDAEPLGWSLYFNAHEIRKLWKEKKKGKSRA